MQIAVISGKGGTGKTTLTSSLAFLSSNNLIKVDCDVDASNLHLMFDGKDIQDHDFKGAQVARIVDDLCVNCGMCQSVCRFGALQSGEASAKVDALKCEGCGTCKLVCEYDAIELDYEVTGKTLITQTSKGLISRAEMIPGSEGSGKLVTEVRRQASRAGLEGESNYLIDGSPGIGCSVMASLTGCDYCIITTEPSQSGFEDFVRVHQLSGHFEAETFVVINKYDINLDMTSKIIEYCISNNVCVLGKIPFDSYVGVSINEGIPIVLYEDSQAGKAIKNIWMELSKRTGVK